MKELKKSNAHCTLDEEQAKNAQRIIATETQVKEMKVRIEELKIGPLANETLEMNKSMLANNRPKFHNIVNNFSSKKEALKHGLVEQRKEFEAKISDIERLAKVRE